MKSVILDIGMESYKYAALRLPRQLVALPLLWGRPFAGSSALSHFALPHCYI